MRDLRFSQASRYLAFVVKVCWWDWEGTETVNKEPSAVTWQWMGWAAQASLRSP